MASSTPSFLASPELFHTYKTLKPFFSASILHPTQTLRSRPDLSLQSRIGSTPDLSRGRSRVASVRQTKYLRRPTPSDSGAEPDGRSKLHRFQLQAEVAPSDTLFQQAREETKVQNK